MLFHMRSHERLSIAHVFFWGTFVAHKWKRPPPWEDFCTETLQADDNLQLPLDSLLVRGGKGIRQTAESWHQPKYFQIYLFANNYVLFIHLTSLSWKDHTAPYLKLQNAFTIRYTHNTPAEEPIVGRETFFSCENEHTHTQTIHQLKFYLKKKVLSQRQELPFSFYLSPDKHDQTHPFGMPAMISYIYLSFGIYTHWVFLN